MAPNNTAEQPEFANVRLLVARHVLPAFFVLAQNHYQRKDISRSDLSRFIRQYSPEAMIDLLEFPSFDSRDVIDEALFVAKTIRSSDLPVLTAHLEAIDIELVKQNALKQFS